MICVVCYCLRGLAREASPAMRDVAVTTAVFQAATYGPKKIPLCPIHRERMADVAAKTLAQRGGSP